jgi:Protein of unknown function (DUF2934)
MIEDKEQRIREIAYRIWENEGCPPNQAERHWEMARKAIEAEEMERVRIAVGMDGPEKKTGHRPQSTTGF